MRIKGLWRLKKIYYELRNIFFPKDTMKICKDIFGDKFVIGKESVIEDANIVVTNKCGCSFKIGSKVKLECNIVFEKENAEVKIGDRVFVGKETLLDVVNSIVIGSDVMIGFNSVIMDHDSHSVVFKEREADTVDWLSNRKNWKHVQVSPIKICDKVWIGAHVKILKGITIGEGVVVAMGSVVTKDVPAWTLVGGNPARVIRELSSDLG